MSLIAKLAWLALPALAECGVLAQVTSQRAGTNPGFNAKFTPPQGFSLSNLNAGNTPSAVDPLLALYNNAPSPTRTQLAWNGVPIPEEDLAQLKVENGTVKIPVVTDGKIDPFWNGDPTLSLREPIEAGKAQGLSVAGADATTLLLVTKPSETGAIRSKKFPITSEMKRLDLRMIGNGDMADTYLSLKISIEGGPEMGWAKQAPTSSSSFEIFSVDLNRILERAGGKEVVGQFEIVDGSPLRVIGIGAETPSVHADSLRLNSVAGARTSLFDKYHIPLRFAMYSHNFAGAKKPSFSKSLDERSLDTFIDSVSTSIYRDESLAHRRGMSVSQLGNMLLDFTDNYVKRSNLDASDTALREIAFLNGVGAWVATYVPYDSQMLTLAPIEMVRMSDPQFILNREKPGAVCGGHACLVRDLIRSVSGRINIKAYYVSGYFREFNGAVTPGPDHAWAVAIMSNGLQVPIDASVPIPNKDTGLFRKVDRKIYADMIAPISLEDTELFLARYYPGTEGKNRIMYSDQQDMGYITDMSFSKWLQIKPNHLQELSNLIRVNEVAGRPYPR